MLGDAFGALDLVHQRIALQQCGIERVEAPELTLAQRHVQNMGTRLMLSTPPAIT